jgi:preprotein translocase subunit SecA
VRPPGERAAAAAAYPERDAAPAPALDRLLARARHLWRGALSPAPAALAARALAAAREAAREGPAGLATRVPAMRYRLRRDAWRPGPAADCLGLAWAALCPEASERAPAAGAGALALLEGAVAELGEPRARAQALELAAVARAIGGDAVHVIASSAAGAQALAERLRAPLGRLGLDAACVAPGSGAAERRAAYAAAVTCAPLPELAADYLRDRRSIGARRRAPVYAHLQRLAQAEAPEQAPLLRGLQCALVEEADAVMLDDALQPLALYSDTGGSEERHVYEQALELARALAPGEDFALEAAGARLTAEGARRLAQLSVLLGPVWAARQRREALARAALAALHLRAPARDYAVQQGRLTWPAAAGPDGAPEADEALVRDLVTVKEGCDLPRQRDVLFRVSVPRLLRRYLHLGALCADARGLRGEFWSLYGMPTRRAGAPAAPPALEYRVFRSEAGRRAALLAEARARLRAGQALHVAARSAAEAQALRAQLAEAGAPCPVTAYPEHRQRPAPADGTRHLLLAELHDAGRHVAQIARACGAPSATVLLALEERSVALHLGARAALARLARGEELPRPLARRLARRAQRGMERLHAALRQELVLREQQLDDLLAFAGRRD